MTPEVLLSAEEIVTLWLDGGGGYHLPGLSQITRFANNRVANYRVAVKFPLLSQTECNPPRPKFISSKRPRLHIASDSQGTVLFPIVLALCINSVAANLTTDHLVYTSDFKVIASLKQMIALRL